MFISVIPMFLVPEGGIQREIEDASVSEISALISAGKIFTIFIIAIIFINFGRNSIAVIQSQYLVLSSGFSVSSKVLSYIVNTQSVAMILTGLVAGWVVSTTSFFTRIAVQVAGSAAGPADQ